MVRCAHCGLHYLNPQPTRSELTQYYPESYDPFCTPRPSELPLLQRLGVNYGLHKRRRTVMGYKRHGRLLEVGCANGLFLDVMRRIGGWHTQGVDISLPAVQYARQKLALDVFHGELQAAGFPDHAFDAVVMWDVLEHVHHPRETLVEIRRVLKPDGVFIFRLPLLDSWDRGLFGDYWVGWDAPRHLTLFSMNTLERMLAQTGFRLERLACVSGSYPAFALSIRFWARDHLSIRTQKWLRKVLESLVVRLVVSPYFYLTDRLVKSTVVTIIARPDRFESSASNNGG